MKTLMQKRLMLSALTGGMLVTVASSAVFAHPGSTAHAEMLITPIAGERNNYWYDYRSDLEEAEIELRKDLRRAKTAQDRREAHQEYNRELVDARRDYTQEMVERGYLTRGSVEVLDR